MINDKTAKYNYDNAERDEANRKGEEERIAKQSEAIKRGDQGMHAKADREGKPTPKN